MTPALRRQRQAYLCEFKASLVYRISSRTAWATQRNPVSKSKNKQTDRKTDKKNSNKYRRIKKLENNQ